MKSIVLLLLLSLLSSVIGVTISHHHHAHRFETAFQVRSSTVPITLYDYGSSGKLVQMLTREINEDLYHLRRWEKQIRSQQPIIIVDVGANMGAFSIAACLYYPDATIYSLEPLSYNYKNLLLNLRENGCNQTVKPFHLGMSNNNSPRVLSVQLERNSGGASAFSSRNNPRKHKEVRTEMALHMTTLDQFISTQKLPYISLLKIDCEGCEYETLQSSTQLQKVHALVGEWHLNDVLRQQGYHFHKLMQHLKSSNPDMLVHHVDIEMRK